MDINYKYLKYKTKYLNLKKEDGQKGGGELAVIILYKAEWCGHCKQFKSEWERLTNMNEFKNKIKFETVDADSQADKVEAAEVTGFPTILLRTGNKIITYNKDRDADSLAIFINEHI